MGNDSDGKNQDRRRNVRAIAQQGFAGLDDRFSKWNSFRQLMQKTGVHQPQKQNNERKAGTQQNERDVCDVARWACAS